jgi:hypothetical protein
MSAEDMSKLRTLFDEYAIECDPTVFKKIVRLSEKPFYKPKEPIKQEALKTPAVVER